jgi:broad specificity phosphatase PhoE
VLTGRRRLWFLASRSAQDAYNRACPSCARLVDDDDKAVLAVCLGVVAAMLVRDVLDTTSAETLLAPVASLLPPVT